MIPIVLASASPRRRALLMGLGIEIEVVAGTAEEVLDGVPGEVVLHNARIKRDEIAARVEGPAMVIAADTIVVLGDWIMGKPADLDEARVMLRALSGRTHEVLTGVALRNTETRQSAEGFETTRVTFRNLNEIEIGAFVEAVNPVDRAGAYTVDGPGSLLVARYEGCYQNVLGLPIVCLDNLLRSLGDSLFARMRGSHARFL